MDAIFSVCSACSCARFNSLRLLLDAFFEGTRPRRVLVVLGLQLAAHGIEGAGEFADFVVRPHFDLISQIPCREAFGTAFQGLHRMAHHLPDEEPTQQRDQQQSASGVEDHAPAAFGELDVGLGQREVGVEDAEDLLFAPDARGKRRSNRTAGSRSDVMMPSTRVPARLR